MDDLEPITGLKKLPSFDKQADGFTRNDVIRAFQRAFLMTGGVDRLTLWANANYTEFIKLYGRFIPAATQLIGAQGPVLIEHALPPTQLDVHPGQTLDEETGALVIEVPPT